MRILGIIPARGGSKGLPGKNIRRLAGKPLIQYAGETAAASGVIHRTVVSTDDNAIAKLATELGLEVPCIRPSELARDDSPMMGVVLHMLGFLLDGGYQPDAVMLLQPTSPLRTPDHLRRAVELLGDNESVCSVVAVCKDANPYSMMKVRDGYLEFLLPEGSGVTRRQDLPHAYRRDGTVFLVRTQVLLQQQSLYGTRCVPLHLKHWEAVNIDTLEDWEQAEALLKRENIDL